MHEEGTYSLHASWLYIYTVYYWNIRRLKYTSIIIFEWVVPTN